MAHGPAARPRGGWSKGCSSPLFSNPLLDALSDAATARAPAGRLAMTADSFVVQPLRFPGGSIGELAVNGTLNDLAVPARGRSP